MAKKGNNKKNKNVEKIEEITFSNNGWYNKVILILVVISILCLFYLLTVHLTEGGSNESTTGEPIVEDTVIQYNEILAGSTFNKSDDKYFVVYYDMSSEDISDISEAISTYNSKEDSLPLYVVDMSNSLNKKYVSKESNKSVTSAADLRINGVTLVRIKNGKLDKYLEGETEVVEYLK